MVTAMDGEQNHPTPICPCCEKPMRFTPTTLGIGAPPELYTYDCEQCGVAVTQGGTGGTAGRVLKVPPRREPAASCRLG